MGYLVERFGEVEKDSVNVLLFIQSSGQVVNCHDQLSFT